MTREYLSDAPDGERRARTGRRLHRVRCTHPCHVARELQDLRYVVLWPHPAPGEWWHCAPCTRRDVRRMEQARRQAQWKLVVRNRGKYFRPYQPKKPRRRLGERFVTLSAQTQWANRYAPPGRRWCTWTGHYVASEAMSSTRGGQASTLCQWCRRAFDRYTQIKRELRLRERRYSKEI